MNVFLDIWTGDLGVFFGILGVLFIVAGLISGFIEALIDWWRDR